jgi:hypothetical protein
MFDFIIKFLKQPRRQENIFSEQYKRSYNKLWIQSLRTYSPK